MDKVIVYEGVWSEGNRRGSRRQQVDVYLKYIGNFDAPDMRTPEQVEADRIAEEKLEANRAYHREKTRKYNERKRQREAENEIPLAA